MSCPNQKQNAVRCNCTYLCSRKGYCCECILYHRAMGQLPACYFAAAAEKTYDRSIDSYLRQNS